MPWIDPTDQDGPEVRPGKGQGVSLLDVGKEAAAGAAGLAGSVGSTVQYLGERYGDEDTKKFGRGIAAAGSLASEWLRGSQSEAAKDTQEHPWEHPVSKVAMTLSGAAPAVAAFAIFPEGIVSEMIAGGAFQTSQVIDGVMARTNEMDDQELAKASPKFKEFLDAGDTPDAARAKLHQLQLGGATLLESAVVGAATGGVLGRAVRGSALGKGGRLSRTAVGAAEGAVLGAAGVGQAEYAIQGGDVAAGLRAKIDYADIVDNAAWAAVSFGAAGGGFGAVSRRRGTSIPEIAPLGPDISQRDAIAATNPLPVAAQRPETATTAPQAPGAPPVEPVGPTPPVPSPSQPLAPAAAVAPPTVGPKVTETATVGQTTPVPAPAKPELPTPVTTPGTEPATVPEKYATLRAQLDRLISGKTDRKAVMIPRDVPFGQRPRKPKGFEKIQIAGDTYIFDPKKINEAELRDIVKAKRQNEILELGPFNKEDVIASADGGAPEVGVVERTPDGTEVRAAAGTTETADAQVAAMAPAVERGNELVVEPASDTLAKRADPEPLPKPIEPKKAAAKVAKEKKVAEDIATVAAGKEALKESPKVHRDLTAKDELVPVHKVPGEELEGPKKSHKSLHDQGKKEQDAIIAKNLFDEHVPEKDKLAVTMAEKQELWQRLDKMVKAAEAKGVEIKERPGRAGNSDYIVYLRDAQQMRDALANGKVPQKKIETFLMDERAAKAGDFEQLRTRRKIEGDEKFRKDQGDVATMEDTSADKPDEVVPKSDAHAGKSEIFTDEVKSPDEEPTTQVVEDVPESTRRPDEAFQKDLEAGKERPKVKSEGHIAIAGKDKAGTFKAEVTKKRTPLTGVGKKGEEVLAKTRKEGTLSLGKKSLHVSPKGWDAIEGSDRPKGSGTKTNVHEIMGDMNHDRLGRGLARAIGNKITNRLRQIVGAVPVEIWTPAQMEGQFPGRGHLVGGFYWHNRDMIVIADRHMIDGQVDSHIMIHEALHAAFAKTLDATPAIHDLMTKMLKATDAAIRDRLKAAQLSTYGLQDIHEFLSEGLSNPEFQEALMGVPLPKDVARKLNAIDKYVDRTAGPSVWDGIVQIVRKFVLRVTGKSEKEVSMLDGLLRATNHLDDVAGERVRSGVLPDRSMRFLKRIEEPAGAVTDVDKTVSHLIIDPMEKIQGFAKNIVNNSKSTSNLKRWGFKFLTNINMQGFYEHLFPNGVFRAFRESLERMDMYAHVIAKKGNDLTRTMVQLSRKYPMQWNEFQKLLQDSRYYSVHADKAHNDPLNAHLTSVGHAQGSAKHAELSTRFNALPGPLKALYRGTVNFYDAAHADFAKRTIDKLFASHTFPAGTDIAGIKTRLHNDTVTAADRTVMEGAMGKAKADAMVDAVELHKVEGPYVPLSRRGEFVVQAEHSIATPPGAKRTKNGQVDPNGNTFEFTDEGKLRSFLKDLPIVPKVRKIFLHPDTGKHMSEADAIALDKTQYPQGADARFRVNIDPKHIEYHESQTAARASREGLEADRRFNNVRVERRREGSTLGDTELSSPQVQALVRALQKDTRLSAQAKEAAIRDLNDTSIALQRGNRIQKHGLKAEKISGADADIIRNTMDYNLANSRARARMEFEPTTDKNLKIMRQRTKQANDGSSLLRSDVLQEMENRLYSTYRPDANSKFTQVMNKLSTVSYLKRMASPAHLLIHMTHPAMISMPVLGSRHGFGQASAALLRAYGDMGARGALSTGIKGFIRLAKDSAADSSDFIEYFKHSLGSTPDSVRLGKMLDELVALNVVHPEAGMEVHRMAPGRGRLSAGLDRVDGAIRELTQATESINRVAEAVAAYRLEYLKTGNHDAAVTYAGNTLANSQGLYSRSNAAPIFRNPALKPFLQFKQFPQMIYSLLARNLYMAFKGETREIKMAALKQFAGVVGTHAIMAGALGLPLEIAKVPVMLAHAFGFSSLTWEDIEDKATKTAAGAFGPGMAEIIMHGLPRAAGPFAVDLHHRLGLSALLTFGEPEGSTGDDTLKYIYDFIGGAPASLVKDTFNGSQEMMKGNIAKGASLLLPIKTFADIAKAGKYAYEGGKPMKGGTRPYAIPELITSALGFKPASQSNFDAARTSVFREQRLEREARGERTALIDDWVGAKGAAKTKAFKAVQNYNKSADKASQIKMSALTKALQAKQDEILGFKTTKHNRDMVTETQRLYNAH